MKNTVFIDTSYVIALKFHDDAFHKEAKALAPSVAQALTTEAVLIEIGNSFSRSDWKPHGINAISDFCSDSRVTVVPIDPALFNRAFEFFSARLDKDWSLTDCISFVVMQERGLAEALTSDHHFEQAGFRALLRDRKNQKMHE